MHGCDTEQFQPLLRIFSHHWGTTTQHLSARLPPYLSERVLPESKVCMVSRQNSVVGDLDQSVLISRQGVAAACAAVLLISQSFE